MIAKDCFYQILELMKGSFLERFFGANFMSSETWLGDFIQNLKLESLRNYPRESFMMSFYIASENLYGLSERANSFNLDLTEKGLPYRLYSLDRFPH